MKSKNILICIANNYGFFPRYFLMSLFKMQFNFYKWQFAEKRSDTLNIIIHGGYNLDEMRNDCVKQGLEQKADYLLFLDTDQNFPEFTIPRMMQIFEANEGCEVVSGLYFSKTEPYIPQIFTKFDEKIKKFNRPMLFPTKQPFPIAGAGAGILMVDTKVFKRGDYPYFKFIYEGEDKELPDGIGEDLYFFWKFKPKALCDPAIICGHYDTRPIDIRTYLSKNKIKVLKNGRMTASKKALKEFEDKISAKEQASKKT